MVALIGAFLMTEAQVVTAFAVFTGVIVFIGSAASFQHTLLPRFLTALLFHGRLIAAFRRTLIFLIFFVFHDAIFKE